MALGCLMKSLLLLFHRKVAAADLVFVDGIHKTQAAADLGLLLPALLALLLPAVVDGDGGFEGSDDDEDGGGGSDSSEDPDSDPSSFPLPAFDFLLQQQTFLLPLLLINLVLVLFLPQL